MTVKEFQQFLSQFDDEKEIVIQELSDLYDTVLVAIEDDPDCVILNIKNFAKGQERKMQ